MTLRHLVFAALVALSALGRAQDRPVSGASTRIGVRVTSGQAEFFDRATGKRFTLRGNNYIRLAPQRKVDGTAIPYHSTFNPGLYNPKEASQVLAAMAADGYTVVRVFLNYCCEGGLGFAGSPLSKPYMDNVADFLKRAQAAAIRVMFTIDWIPIPARQRQDGSMWCSDFQCTSVQVLTQEGVRANAEFFSEFARELVARRAPLSSIFAYELRNELTFETLKPPLSLSSGSLTVANGLTYDLSKRSEKIQMLDEGIVYWINRVRSAILSVDPLALVTVGFVPPKSPDIVWAGMADASVVGRPVRSSNLDFVDIHVYPEGSEFRLEALMDDFGVRGFESKPVVLGEFGALTAAFPSAQAAARVMPELVRESCRLGADGWIFWAWDTNPYADVYSGLDAQGIINRALAPKLLPDPCSHTPAKRLNLAWDATFRASRSYEESRPAQAADAFMTPWNSGGEAPQWIEIDLKTAQRVGEIRLVVSQTPEGQTRHQIWVGQDTVSYRLHTEISRRTRDRQVLNVPIADPRPIRFVKIVTLASPSWVAWREIEVFPSVE